MPYLKVVAEANLEALIGRLVVALVEVDLCHEDVSVRIRAVLLQAVLQRALCYVHITWGEQRFTAQKFTHEME